MQEWKKLKETGKVNELSIEYYPFAPMTHFIIVDGKSLLFGLHELEASFPGVSSTTHDSFRVDSDSNIGRLLISNFRAVFEDTWSEFGATSKQQTE